MGETQVDLVELLVVEYCFDTNMGLVLVPDFPITDNSVAMKNDDVTIVTPDGARLESNAEIAITHLNLTDRTGSTDKRWRLSVFLKNLSKADVPIESRLLVPANIAGKILTRQPSAGT
jgi:hypothetical protein